MITAFSGTSSERKTTIRSRKDRISTAPKKYGSRPPRKLAKSTLIGVDPVTSTSVPVASSAVGRTSSRSRFTSSVVASSCGPVVGTTFHSTAVGFSGSLGTGGVTTTTPGSAATASVTALRASRSPAPSTSATSRNGPLKPSPKPSTSRS